MELCTRKDVPVEQTWDLSLIFPEEKLMWEALDQTKAEVRKFAETYAGRLNTADMIVKCLDDMEPIRISIERIWCYTGLAVETDYTDNQLRERDEKVSDEVMAKGYRLKIYDAYRPQMAVTNFVNWAKDAKDIRMKEYFYPDLEKDVLFPQGYIYEHSGHSRGSTVDLTLFDMKTEKELDMGGTFDFFGEESHPDYKDITKEQYNHRMILREAMLNNGFKPLAEEWWHFTLENEPYPDTYFTFPINSDSLKK